MNEMTLITPDQEQPLTVGNLRAQVNLIQTVMKEVMHSGEHYGKIPGCGPKPTLLKPGAEKLILTFRLVPDPLIEVIDLGDYHREYRVILKLYSQSGRYLGGGVGSCSTMETKYRFRKDKDGKRVENDNPADNYNTCEKMAKKRALVDACLTVTAASDIFTQDIEEMDIPPQPAQPAPRAPEKPQDERKAQALGPNAKQLFKRVCDVVVPNRGRSPMSQTEKDKITAYLDSLTKSQHTSVFTMTEEQALGFIDRLQELEAGDPPEEHTEQENF
jgi:hypothetical protein